MGRVVEPGEGVRGLREGDAVGLPWLHHACGRCESGRTGWEMLCESQRNSGYSVNGIDAEYAVATASSVRLLPEHPDFAAFAPILCAGSRVTRG